MTEHEKREKVSQGLKWCMNEEHDCYREKGCPYENEGEDVGCKYALHRDALELLKEQEPVEPKHEDDRPISPLRCGNCGAFILVTNDYKAKYCFECGRAVRWTANGGRANDTE